MARRLPSKLLVAGSSPAGVTNGRRGLRKDAPAENQPNSPGVLDAPEPRSAATWIEQSCIRHRTKLIAKEEAPWTTANPLREERATPFAIVRRKPPRDSGNIS